MVASGDILLHDRVQQQARADALTAGEPGYSFRSMLAGTTPAVSAADLALCHLEVPLGRPGERYTGYPAFSGPPEVADALAEQGYDSCSTASNHSLDQGERGVVATLDALDASGIRHAGTARTRSEAEQPTILDVHGVRVAHLAATYGFNVPAVRGKPWLAATLGRRGDGAQLLARAAAARRAGAEVVIASVHWGDEYDHRPNAQQRSLGARLLASPDIDLVVGHHAHVVQPMQRIRGEWVAYGLGNLVAAHRRADDATREGVLPTFTFTEAADGRFRVSRVEALPTLVRSTGPLRVVTVQRPALASAADDRARRARERTRRVLLSRGADRHGLIVR